MSGPRRQPLLLEGLKRLEYRGYDSAGVAIMNGDGVETREGGREDLAARGGARRHAGQGTTGIAHTRWATHGAPNRGQRPSAHATARATIAVVHNGIIENTTALKTVLEERGHKFRSETDTEVLAHLIEEALRRATSRTPSSRRCWQVEGTYGIAVVSSDDPDKIVAARKGSPLLVGLGDGEYFVASDVSAILAHTRKVVYLDDGEMAVLEPRRLPHHRPRRDREPTKKVARDRLGPRADRARRLRALHAQGDLRAARDAREHDARPPARRGGDVEARRPEPDRRRAARVRQHRHHRLRHELALGADRRAHDRGADARSGRGRVRVRVPLSQPDRRTSGTLCIVISQSGETADTLAAMREAKRRGARTLGIVNVVGLDDRARGGRRHLHPRRSGNRRRVDQGVHQPGHRARCCSRSSSDGCATCRSCAAARSSRPCTRFPGQIQQILDRAEEIEALAEEFKRASNFLYLGRGYNFPVALEGALKLKEISYIHAEGYPAAEMKHGPIALIDEMMPVVFIAPHDSVFDKIVVEHPGGEGAEGPRHRDHEPRRGGARREGRLRDPHSGNASTC